MKVGTSKTIDLTGVTLATDDTTIAKILGGIRFSNAPHQGATSKKGRSFTSKGTYRTSYRLPIPEPSDYSDRIAVDSTLRRMLLLGSFSQAISGAAVLGEGLGASTISSRKSLELLAYVIAITIAVVGGISCRGKAPRMITRKALIYERTITKGAFIQGAASIILPIVAGNLHFANFKLTVGLMTAFFILGWLSRYVGVPRYGAEALALLVGPPILALFVPGHDLMLYTSLFGAAVLWTVAILNYSTLSRMEGAVVVPRTQSREVPPWVTLPHPATPPPPWEYSPKPGKASLATAKFNKI